MILTGLLIYMALMLFIGVYAARGTQSSTDFMIAGRRLPLWLCSTSIFATWFGSGIMMGAATSAYDRDFLAMIAEPFGSALALLLSGLFFARICRRTRRVTWIEFFEVRYGKIAGLFAAFADVGAGIIWVGGLLFTFGILTESLTGLPMAAGIVVGLVVIVSYTMVGGMMAVVLTDFLQTLILVVGLVVLLFVVLGDVGGWRTISVQLPENTIRFFPIEHSFQSWVDYIHVWMTLGVAAIAANSVIQRALSARTEAVAQNSFLLAGVGYTIIGCIPLALGLIASVTMPDIADPNAVLSEMAVKHLHPVVTVIFVGAILSAIMSTSDSVLLSTGSIVSTNLLPFFVKNASDRLRLRVARISIPVAAAAATYVAFGAERVVEVLIESAAPLLAMTIAPFILCFWWRKANNYGALAGILGGLFGWILAGAMESNIPPDLIGFCVSFTAMIIVSSMTQSVCPPKPLTDDEGNAVELTNRVATFR